MKKLLLLICVCIASMASAFAQTEILSNGGFESWTDGVADDWKSTTTASSATVSQSTDARTGSYAALVAGNASQNKRLGSKEYTLKAGTYTMTCYVKGAGQVRPGYVPVTDGKVGSYAYGSYVSTTADDWTIVENSFTLEKETTVNFVLMNPKTSDYAEASDKLVDDFSVTTTDGGISDGSTDPETEDGTIFSEPFNTDLGEFTSDNVSMDEALSYVWSWGGANYGAKASAYVSGTNYASESWLLSPEISLDGYEDATLTFDHVANYFSSQDNFLADCDVKIRVVGGEWTDLTYTGNPAGTNWTYVSATADLTSYVSNTIQVAFVYTSSADRSGTWEIKNFLVSGTKTQDGIADVVTEKGNTVKSIFSLDGRKLQTPVKGINIINGKKVLVK